MSEATLSAVDQLAAMAPAIAHATALGAILPVEFELAAQAAASDARRTSGRAGFLEGMMISVKGNVAVNGAPTSGATPSLVDYQLPEGLAISRLRSAGAIFTAKTNLHELALGITGANSFSGPVLNPFDPLRLAGGSSSGSAVAVAVRACTVSVGTDTGGSCRIPASHCGVVGFRPTLGRYPDDGCITLSQSRDTIGLLARAIADVVLVDSVITNDFDALPTVELPGAVFGVVRFTPIDADVASLFEASLELLRRSGVILIDVDLTEALAADLDCGFVISVYETAQNIAVLAGQACSLSLLEFAQTIASADVREMIAGQAGPDAIPEAVYREAIDVALPKLRSAFSKAMQDVNLLIYPTTPLTAPLKDHDDLVNVGGELIPVFPAYTIMTRPDSMAGLPSVSLPAGTINGLPSGLQLVGIPGSDRSLLAAAKVVEAILPPRGNPPSPN